MKKLLVLFALVCISFLGYSQDVKVNINNQDGTAKDDCPYRINGICATEDIGGVDVEFEFISEETYPYHSDYFIVLTNYNNFPVNVLWQIEYNDKESSANGTIKTGNVVIGIEGQKKIKLPYYYNGWSVKGLIVRKLAQQ